MHRRAGTWIAPRLAVVSTILAIACDGPDLPAPDRTALRHPTGLAVIDDGRLLVVSNGNWDAAQADGTMMLVDLPRLYDTIADGRCPADADGVWRCDPARVVIREATVRPGSGVGNIAVDRPVGPSGPHRLFVTTRSPAAVVWLDVRTGSAPRFDCGQDDDGICDTAHRITRSPTDDTRQMPSNPARIEIDDQGYRFAYVPHLLGGTLSLVALDGEPGPRLVDVEEEFFRIEPSERDDLAGGFAIAQRACDPADPPAATRDCERPQLYATQRYFPGLRSFTVAPGLDLLIAGPVVEVAALDPMAVDSRPYMGDLAFEDPSTGQSLLVVQTTPPALVRLDMQMEDGRPRARVLATVPLCKNPNVLAIHRPADAPSLALVTCFGDGELAVVDLATFALIDTIAVGAGANEIAIDPVRAQAYVAATQADAIAVVSLDRTSPDYLTMWARISAR